MSSELSAYEAAIRDLEAERKEIDSLIEGLRRRLDKAAGGTARSESSANIPDDAFFGMTVADAAKKYLSIVKQTKTTAEISEGLRQGGLTTSATDLPSTVRAIIGQRDEFMRVNGKWGLAVWYPGIKRSKQGRDDSESQPKSKQKKERKAASKKPPKESDPQKKEKKASKNNAPLVLHFLAKNPGSHTVEKIAEAIDASNLPSLRALLSVMVGDGRIAKGTPTGYQSKT